MSRTFILDATLDRGDGVHCFCPIEFDEDGNVSSVVVGMNFLSANVPAGGVFHGVFHEDGQDACDAWCAENSDEIERVARAAQSAALPESPKDSGGAVSREGET